MRAKRSKDARRVEKFGKQKDSLAAETPVQQPVCSADADKVETAYTEEDDHDELKVGKRNGFENLHIIGC